MSKDVCQFCGDKGFKTDGKSQLICEKRANTGRCGAEANLKKISKVIKQGRNNLCFCKSGKKYKKCCNIEREKALAEEIRLLRLLDIY